MAMHGHSAACCSVPPVVAKEYKQKGEYITLDGTKIYKTGSSSAKRAIFFVGDIFGYFPQTLQGADIIAYGDKEHEYQVFVPDLFDGKPADISWYPPKTDEQKEKLGNFFQTTANPQKATARVPKLVKAIEKEYSSIETWGILGFCWGGKITNLSSQSGTPFKAAAVCHPAMTDAKDAANITIPFAMFPSGDEDKDDVAAWEKDIKVKHQVKWYKDNVHGFMAARSNLEKEDERKAYTSGYQDVLEWFHETL